VFQIRALSEFDLVHLARTGQLGELKRRLDRAQATGRNIVRVLGMASIMFDLRPDQPGYWEAWDVVMQAAAERGIYVEAVAFADAQIVMPSHADRAVFLGAFCTRLAHDNRLLSLANEAFKNGWSEADDPELLALADSVQTTGRPFIISDPVDSVDSADGQPLRGKLDHLADHSPILALHGERKSQDQRWAGWVDHLKGFEEVAGDLGRVLYHQEPMGAASVYQDGRRDNRPLAHLAASLVAAVMQMGYCYHYISGSDDATPGLDLSAAAALIPHGPTWNPRNAGTAGAAVLYFEGYDKIRTCDNGIEVWAVGYGRRKGIVNWDRTWNPSVYDEWADDTGVVTLWRATRAA
jgi:hypothetical protein